MIFQKHVNASNARSTSRQNMLASHFQTEPNNFEGKAHILPKSTSTQLLIDDALRVQCGISKSNSPPWYQRIYKKAANMAPAKPRAAPPALMWVAAPLALAEVVALPLAVPEAPEAPEPAAPLAVPDAAVVDEALTMEVTSPEKRTVTVVLPNGTVFSPEVRPAGKVAGRGWLVTTAGWVVMATAAVGWPVMTPLEFVSVRNAVFGLEYGATETLEL